MKKQYRNNKGQYAHKISYGKAFVLGLLITVAVGFFFLNEKIMFMIDEAVAYQDSQVAGTTPMATTTDDRTDIEKLTEDFAEKFTALKEEEARYEDEIKRAEAIIKNATDRKNQKVEEFNQSAWNLEQYTN